MEFMGASNKKALRLTDEQGRSWALGQVAVWKVLGTVDTWGQHMVKFTHCGGNRSTFPPT